MADAASACGSPSLARPFGPVTGQRLLIAIHIVLTAAMLMPLALVDIPALVDYPNHLARMRIMAEWASSPDLQRAYSVDLSPMPNIAMDLVVPWLAKIIGVLAAGKLFIAATLLLFTSSTVALQWAVQGRVGISSLAVYLIVFNLVLSFGFLNYLLGIGAAILLLAAWIGLQHRGWWLRTGLGAVGSVAILFCHPIAFACYGLCIVTYELSRCLRSRHWRACPGVLVMAGFQFLPALAVLLAVRARVAGPDLDIHYVAGAKLMSLLTPTYFYFGSTETVLTAALLASLGLLRFKADMRFEPALAGCAAGLAVAVLAVPTWMSGNWGNDFRLMVPLVMVVIAACRLEPRELRFLLAAAAAVLAVFTLRVVTIAHTWVQYDGLYSEISLAAAELEPNARVLPAVANTDRIDDIAPTAYSRVFDHVPALLLLHSSAFVPTLFTTDGRQPLSASLEFSHIDIPHGRPLPLPVLALAVDPQSGAEIVERSVKGDFYHHRFAGWPANFDYVLMIDFGRQQNPLPTILTRAVSGSYFTLYRVAVPGPGVSATPRRSNGR